MEQSKNKLQIHFGEHNPEEIYELSLEQLFFGPFTPSFKKCWEEYSNWFHLNLNQTFWSDWSLLPRSPHLRILELSRNKITDVGWTYVKKLYPKLMKLDISFNWIANVTSLKMLDSLKLEILCIQGNPVVENEKLKWNDILFRVITTLLLIDNVQRDGTETTKEHWEVLKEKERNMKKQAMNRGQELIELSD